MLAGLDGLVQRCLDHGANVLLMTLMEVADPMASVEQQRQQLNKLITEYVQQQKWDRRAAAGDTNQRQQEAAAGARGQHPRRLRPQVHLFDLATAFPFESLGEEQRFELWDDGVHLTVVGYERMGVIVTEALIPLVKQELSRVTAAGNEQQPEGNGSKKLN